MDEKFTLRPATLEDSPALFELSNDPLVRRQSMSSTPIARDEHEAWFQAQLDAVARGQAHFYIAEKQDAGREVTSPGQGTASPRPMIGQVRFAPKDGENVISVSVHPAYRGRNFASRLIAEGCRRSGLDRVLAYIKEDNIASIKSFTQSGFTLLQTLLLDGISYNLYAWQRPVYIIAEMSANHAGSIQNALDVIRAAKDAGADAVKIQTYTADTLTIPCTNDYFTLKGGLWDKRNLYELYQEAFTPWEWTKELMDYAAEIGIDFFSTPFDTSATDFLDELGVPCFKIASFEALDLPLVRYIAAKGKPLIISTGICTEADIRELLDTCRQAGNHDVTLLKCTSAYPALPEDMHLSTIPHMIRAFGTKVGLSDHTMNVETCTTAVALGARVVEKHFTLDRALGGPDAAFSLNPAELKATVEAIRLTEKLLGTPSYDVPPSALRYARSLFIVEDIRAGEPFTETNLRSIRPGDGCPPKLLPELLGKVATRDLSCGTPMSPDYAADPT